MWQILLNTFSLKRHLALAAIALALGLGRAGASTYTVLHSFDSPPDTPLGLASDSFGNLYGTSFSGGLFGWGTVYKIGKDGTGFSILHSFSYKSFSDGVGPSGSLVVSGTDIYGTTVFGGSSTGGTVFTMKTDGTGFTVLHSFAINVNGAVLDTSLISDGAGNLYGTTAAGGLNNLGTIFALTTSGSGFSILHSFAGGTSDGSTPQSPLTLDGAGNLYGISGLGGQSDAGTVFKIDTAGTTFSVIHSFGSGPTNGSSPQGPLTSDGLGNLYGTSGGGGSHGLGTIFTIETASTGFAIIHSFTGSTSDGSGPRSSLVLDSTNILYGTTNGGGAAGLGTVFRVSVTGAGFSLLHSFGGGLSDGSFPGGALILDASGNLYGTSEFGPEGGAGGLFTIKEAGTGFSVLRSFTAPEGKHLYGSLIRDGAGFLYGTCKAGGLYGYGTIFKMRPDGEGLTVIHSFSGGSSDGANPESSLVLDGLGKLYGTTNGGGSSSSGTVFTIKTDGSGFALLHSFGLPTEPNPWLLLDGFGNLYGTSISSGANGQGSVFKMRTDGTGFSEIHSFVGAPADGALPFSPLVLLGSGDLYGVTASGGASGKGSVFSLKTSGAGFRLLHSFGVGSDGATGGASLIVDGGVLYGTTILGGTNGFGTIFRVESDGTGYASVYSFDHGESNPSLIGDGLGNLTGTLGAISSPPFFDGLLFSFLTGGAEFSTVYTFTGSPGDGSNPNAALLRDTFGSGDLFGTTMNGGALGGGTVFEIASDVVGASLPAPVINSPAEGEALSSSRVSLNWGFVNGVSGYDLLVIDDSSGDTLYSGSLSGFGSTSTAVDLPNGGLTFGVRACSGGFADANCGPFATVDFTVNVLPPTTSTTKFYTLTPCRVVDTRNPDGLYGGPALSAGVSRVFTLAGQCGIPTGAKAVSVNITVVVPTSDGTLKLNPTGAEPTVATAISFSAGCIRANNAIAFLGNDGAVSIEDDQATGTTNFIIDVNGYFK